MAEAKELDLAIKVSIIELGATVKKIVDHYHAAGVREENQRAITELQRIMEFLAQALVDVRVRERQFLSASGQALGELSGALAAQSIEFVHAGSGGCTWPPSSHLLMMWRLLVMLWQSDLCEDSRKCSLRCASCQCLLRLIRLSGMTWRRQRVQNFPAPF